MAASSRPPLSAAPGYRAQAVRAARLARVVQAVAARPGAGLAHGVPVHRPDGDPAGTIKAYPFLQALWFSFHNVVGFRVGAFVGLDNYIALWGDDRFTGSIGVTLTFTAASVVLKLVLGMSAALLLHNVPRWGAVFGGLLLVPYVVPEVVRALAWRLILDPIFGGLNYILVHVLGMLSKGHPLAERSATGAAVRHHGQRLGRYAVHDHHAAGRPEGIDAEQYDAASVDGAGRWRRFLHITLPGLRYVLLVGTLLRPSLRRSTASRWSICSPAAGRSGDPDVPDPGRRVRGHGHSAPAPGSAWR